MDFVSYPRLILQISGQTLQVTVAPEKFWELNGLEIYGREHPRRPGRRLRHHPPF